MAANTKSKKAAVLEINPYYGQPRPLPMKFHPRALVPCQLTSGDAPEWEYLTADGVKVRFDYRATYNNEKDLSADVLEKTCQELYNMPFATIKAIWARRVGRLDDWWNIVNLIKENA